MNNPSLRICFLTRSLNYGGAERQLAALASGLKKRGHEVFVVLFYGGGALELDLRKHDVQVISLGKGGRWDIAVFMWRLLGVLRRIRPDVCHTYLTVPNVIVSVLKPFLHGARLVWGVRASNMELGHYDRLSRVADRLEAVFVRWADLVIVNSEAGREHAAARGFPADFLITVPNGIDLAAFRPERSRRLELRRSWGARDSDRLIGLVARLDPMKDHGTFLAAVEMFLSSGGVARFICVGDGPDDYRRVLQDEADRRGLRDYLVWVGTQSDMLAVYNALDLVTLTSAFGEGFPNVLGEAMACGIPCVATAVGDSAIIVGDAGIIIPVRDPAALAAAWRNALSRLDEEGETLCKRARAQIASRFGIQAMVTRCETLLVDLLRAP